MSKVSAHMQHGHDLVEQVELPLRDRDRDCVSPYRRRGLKAKGVKNAKCSFGAIYWQRMPKSAAYLFIAATRGDCFIPCAPARPSPRSPTHEFQLKSQLCALILKHTASAHVQRAT